MDLADQRSLSSMFNARAVAVVGASQNVGYGGYGGRVVRNLVAAGFPGEVIPVTPKYTDVQGLKAYRDIRDVPGDVDLAVIVVRADLVPAVLRSCGEKKVPACCIISAGFAERGGQGAKLQDEVVAVARENGIRFSGPNSLGVASIGQRVFASASSIAWDLGALRPGAVSIVSQSGAMAFNSVLSRAHENGVGVRSVVTVGNQADLTVVDFLEYFVEHDEETHVVSMLLEGLLPGDGPRLLKVARRAVERGKTILALKIGRTQQGATAAASHTGSLTGDDAIYEGCFEAAGVIRVSDLDELWQTGHLIAQASGMSPQGELGVLANSGGLNSLFADLCGTEEVSLAETDDATVERLSELLQGFGSATNPADITGHIKRDTLQDMIRAYDADSTVNLTVVGITPSASGPLAVGIADNISAAAAETRTPVVALWASARDLEVAGKATTGDSGLQILQCAGIPVFDEPRKCARALGQLYRHQVARGELVGTVAASDERLSAVTTPFAPSKHDGLLGLLNQYGIPTARSLSTMDWTSTLAAAGELGYPLVMKVDVPTIQHKTELGGVSARVDDAEQLRAAYESLTRVLEGRGETPRFLVQEHVSGELEMIIGGVRDPVFGPIVMIGLGGIWVEAMRDRLFRPAPVDDHVAGQMVQRLRAAPLLAGARGKAPCDVGALRRVLVRFSEFFASSGALAELEINPLIVLREGHGVKAVDALAVYEPARATDHQGLS